MHRRPVLTLLPAAVLLVAACSGTPSSPPASTAPQASTGGGSPTIAPASLPLPSGAAEGSAVPTSLDPCALVTADEASTLAGTTFGAGTESTTSGGAKICTYGSATTAVVNVLVAQAADAATAQADWAQEQAEAQAQLQQSVPAGVSLSFSLDDTSVTGADKAAVGTASASISGVGVAISAIYVLKGAVFFTFSDLAVGHAAAAATALEAQAGTTIGRLP
jgi:hypothetical protein